MAHLDIRNLRCVKTRDGVGKDEIDIYLAIDGGAEQFVSGPHFLDKSKNDELVTLESTGCSTTRSWSGFGTETYDSTVQTARNVEFNGNSGRVAYTALIGVSA